MSKRRQVSLAEARSSLGGVVEDSKSGPIELTRRGEPVAVVVSIEDFRRRPSLWETIQNFRQQVEDEGGEFFDENPFLKRLD